MSTTELYTSIPSVRPKIIRASIYVRLSKAADRENTSKDSMIADCRALCTREGFAEVALHVDDGESGGVRDREEFKAWLSDAREGRADVLVAWHVDRMTREGLNVAAVILDVVEGKDAETGKVITPPVRLMDCNGLDSNNGATFRIMFVIRAEIAREERERIKNRAKGKAGRLRKAGRWPGGPIPYGYKLIPASEVIDDEGNKDPDAPGKTLAIEAHERMGIEEAATRILNGWRLGRACRWLNDNGYLPRRSKGGWTRVTLRQVLTSDHLLGRIKENGNLVRDDKGRPVVVFPPILTLGKLTALRKALAVTPKTDVPDGRKQGGRQPSRILSQVIACDSCGYYMTAVRRKVNARSKAARDSTAPAAYINGYRCQRRIHGGICNAPTSATAEPLEQFIVDMFLETAQKLPVVEHRVVVGNAEELAEVEEKIASALAKLGTAATPEGYAELQGLQNERARLESAPQERQVQHIYTGRTLADEWETSDIEGKRELLQGAFEFLRLKQGGKGAHGFDSTRLVYEWSGREVIYDAA